MDIRSDFFNPLSVPFFSPWQFLFVIMLGFWGEKKWKLYRCVWTLLLLPPAAAFETQGKDNFLWLCLYHSCHTDSTSHTLPHNQRVVTTYTTNLNKLCSRCHCSDRVKSNSHSYKHTKTSRHARLIPPLSHLCWAQKPESEGNDSVTIRICGCAASEDVQWFVRCSPLRRGARCWAKTQLAATSVKSLIFIIKTHNNKGSSLSICSPSGLLRERPMRRGDRGWGREMKRGS